jgi:MoaA/NifB/PqqE/SkfB family radical SAM enzyme
MASAESSALIPLEYSEFSQGVAKDPTINLAIGPSCPVRCEGCYNHFGDTVKLGGLATASEILDFADAAIDEGVTQATVSGGDPLFHPEIVPILVGLKERGLKVKLDTVGTLFLGDAPIVFKGRGMGGSVAIEDVVPNVDFINIPLDGASQSVINRFRRGRPNLFAETRAIAGLLRGSGISFGYNTVAHKANAAELSDIREIAVDDGASEWQVFEYDPDGPNPTNQKSNLKFAPGEFEAATRELAELDGIKISCKSLAARSGIYFLVDDSGDAWKPGGEGVKRSLGNITLDRKEVIDALRIHISQFRQGA